MPVPRSRFPAFLGPALISTLLLSLPARAGEHGGQYRGPSSVAPPNTSGSGNSSNPAGSGGGSSNPGANGGSGGGSSSQPAPPPGRGRGSGAMTGGLRPRGGGVLGEDFSKWQYWWEFNKDHILLPRVHAGARVPSVDESILSPLRRSVRARAQRPDRRQIDRDVLPLLRAVLSDAQQRDIVSACLIGIAKLTRGVERPGITPLLVARLKARDQEIRETAALALGISAQAGHLSLLRGLAGDREAGRQLTGRIRVDHRTRTFATYGLGFLGQKHAGQRPQITAFLIELLRRPLGADRNLPVACIQALGMVAAASPGQGRLARYQEQAAHELGRFLAQELPPARKLLQAHTPTALARILGPGDSPNHRLHRSKLRKLLETSRSAPLRQSAVLALGRLSPHADQDTNRLLRRIHAEDLDLQTRHFALISLGALGGDANRAFLLQRLVQGTKASTQPWAALSLALLQRRRTKPDPIIGSQLLRSFRQARSPYRRGALAIALAITGYREAADALRDTLADHEHQDELAGYLCISLAMLGQDGSQERIQALLRSSSRRPQRLQMAAIALGKLGDRRVSQRLLDLISDGEPAVARMAATAQALALLGDRNAVQPLCKLIQNQHLPALSRAFAVVALAGLSDPSDLPFNAHLARSVNYRAAVETLVQSGSGILDLL